MIDPAQAIRIEIPGRGALSLSPSDHVASGGEGHVYRKSKLAIKIWDDPDRAAKGRMPEKLHLLAALAHPDIVVPEALALDAGGDPIGFVMPWVENGWALPLAFTNDWRAANRFGDSEALAFVARMHAVMRFVHAQGTILGDANEFNILGIAGAPRYIDVDAWVLPGFPGDKTLPTIRDWHSPAFTVEADWFAFAIVTFQLLIGLHPYRGTHPDFKRNDLEGRMRANASVFGKSVHVSPAARPLASIPAALRDWYRAVFEAGSRGPPPDPFAQRAKHAAQPSPTVPATAPNAKPSTGLEITDVYRIAAPVVRDVAPDVVMLGDGSLLALGDGRRYGTADPRAAFVRLADGDIAGALADDGAIRFGVVRAGPGAAMALTAAPIAARAVWSADNRLFAIADDGLLELHAREMAGGKNLLPGRRWALNPHATLFGNGIATYAALTATFLVVPFGTAAVAMLRARELDGLRPIAMTRRGHVATMSLLDRGGAYHRAVVLFTEDYGSYSLTLSDADDGALGDTITPAGVIVRIASNGMLDLASPATGTQFATPSGEAAGGVLLSGPSGVFCAIGERMVRLRVGS